jgi:hypothetical protein
MTDVGPPDCPKMQDPISFSDMVFSLQIFSKNFLLLIDYDWK